MPHLKAENKKECLGCGQALASMNQGIHVAGFGECLGSLCQSWGVYPIFQGELAIGVLASIWRAVMWFLEGVVHTLGHRFL